MNKVILSTLTGLFLSSSMSMAMDGALETYTTSPFTMTTFTEVEQPSGDTAPTGTIVVPAAPQPLWRSSLPGSIQALLPNLSRTKKFNSIGFAEREASNASETEANHFLTTHFHEKASNFSALDIYKTVAMEALHMADDVDALLHFYYCGKSLRHISSISPIGMIDQYSTMVGDVYTIYHVDMLKISEILIQTAIDKAEQIHFTGYDAAFADALSSTQQHLATTQQEVARKQEEIKQEEARQKKLERKKAESQRLKKAVADRQVVTTLSDAQLKHKKAREEKLALQKQQITKSKTGGSKKSKDKKIQKVTPKSTK
jgi:hypothetical protein